MAQSRGNENEVETAVSTKVKEPTLSNETEKEAVATVTHIFPEFVCLISKLCRWNHE